MACVIARPRSTDGRLLAVRPAMLLLLLMAVLMVVSARRGRRRTRDERIAAAHICHAAACDADGHGAARTLGHRHERLASRREQGEQPRFAVRGRRA